MTMSPYGKHPATEPGAITVFWRGYFGRFGPKFFPGTNAEERILRGVIGELWPGHMPSFTPQEYDAVLQALGKYEYGLTVYGGPEEDERILAHVRKDRADADLPETVARSRDRRCGPQTRH